MAERHAVGNPNLWTATVAQNPAQVFVNGVRGERMAGAGDVDRFGRWHWDGETQTLSVHGANSAQPSVEVSLRDIGLWYVKYTG